MNDATVIRANSVAETLRFGRRIGAALQQGWVIGLVGELGVGKTRLVKGLAAGNHMPDHAPTEVTSPTFVLVNEYPGRVKLYHLDAYRLHSGSDLDNLGIEEMIADGVLAVEWADRVVEALPPDHLTIIGRSTGETNRVWTLSAHGPISREWLSQIG